MVASSDPILIVILYTVEFESTYSLSSILFTNINRKVKMIYFKSICFNKQLSYVF